MTKEMEEMLEFLLDYYRTEGLSITNHLSFSRRAVHHGICFLAEERYYKWNDALEEELGDILRPYLDGRMYLAPTATTDNDATIEENIQNCIVPRIELLETLLTTEKLQHGMETSTD